MIVRIGRIIQKLTYVEFWNLLFSHDIKDACQFWIFIHSWVVKKLVVLFVAEYIAFCG